MKIKVGGRYVARDGRIVEIVGKIKGSLDYPFECDQGLSYAEEGFYFSPLYASKHDLIHEFKDEGSSSKLSTILTGLFWLAALIATIGFWGLAAVKLWQMMPGN
jgi:hypothetical protein